MFKVLILCLAAVAVAVPTSKAGDTCGNGNTVHCCNSETAKQLSDHGLIPITADLQNLLGQCNDVTIPVIGAAVPIKNQCSQQAVCCGKIEQNGVINLGCTPLNL